MARGYTSTRVCNSIEPRWDRVIRNSFAVAAHSWPTTSIDSLPAVEKKYKIKKASWTMRIVNPIGVDVLMF